MMNPASHVLGNSWLQVTVRPDLGGRIDSFMDRERQREWVWHPPAYDPTQSRLLSPGASFDENWTGGWDDIFPNDAADPFEGQALHDHGEVWSQPWQVLERSAQGIVLRFDCESRPLSLEKTIILDSEAPLCRVSHRVFNRSDKPQAFLLKQHPALAIDPGDELLMPACELEPVALGFSRIAGLEQTTAFPYVLSASSQPRAIHIMQPEHTELREFLYAKNLAQGFCGIRNQASGTELHFSFDSRDFPYVWIFMSFRGFREHYVLLLEPCSNIPFDLTTAYQNKTCALVEAGGCRRYETTIRLSQA